MPPEIKLKKKIHHHLTSTLSPPQQSVPETLPGTLRQDKVWHTGIRTHHNKRFGQADLPGDRLTASTLRSWNSWDSCSQCDRVAGPHQSALKTGFVLSVSPPLWPNSLPHSLFKVITLSRWARSHYTNYSYLILSYLVV